MIDKLYYLFFIIGIVVFTYLVMYFTYLQSGLNS
jgi:hypothetical protein